jgi:hypothetical protein
MKVSFTLREIFLLALLAFSVVTIVILHETTYQASQIPTTDSPPNQPIKRSLLTTQCAAATSKGDALMFSYFATHNESTLQSAVDAYSAGDTGTLVRLAMAQLMQLDHAACLATIDKLLLIDAFHDKAHLVRAYCIEASGDIEQARAAHDRARALDVRGADRYFSMPGGYLPYRPRDYGPYHAAYIRALVGAFVFTEFTELGLGGKDRWVSQLFDFQDTYASLATAIAGFRDKQYLILRGLMSPFETRLVHEAYKRQLENDLLPNKEPFVVSCVNERIGYFYNQRFRAFISALAEEPLLVTYSYFVTYYGRDKNPGLKAHTDAVDNEFTMSTHVTRDPYDPAWIWPIYFVEQVKSPVTELGTWEHQPAPNDPGVVPAHLEAGDALLFRGRSHPHFREPLDPKLNQSYGNMLSHFVHSDYPVWMSRGEHNRRYADDHDLPTRGHTEFIR